MSKRKYFEGKTTRLSNQSKEVDQNKIDFIKDSFTTKNKEFKRSTFTLTTSDIDWLDQIVKELNRTSVRQISKSELVRVGLHLLKTQDLQDILKKIT
jgi:putative sterol carrier protein